ncbi:MAG: T9SS type A sorting domain-containing protein [Bacteroidia bacterium]
MSQHIVRLSDSVYISHNIVTDSISGRLDCGLMKIDNNGNVISKKTINFQNKDYLWQNYAYNNFVRISNSSMLLLGVNHYNTSTTNNIFCKINTETLDTIKCKYRSDNYSYSILNAIKLHENKYLIVGNKFSNDTTWPYILEIDTNLNFLNSYTMPAYNSIVMDSKLDPVNKRLFLTMNTTVGPNFYGSLLTTDTVGNVLNYHLNTTALNNNYFQTFFSDYDSTYISIGMKGTSIWGGDNLYKLYIVKSNRNTLQPIWQKTYSTAHAWNILYDAVIKDNGSIVASGMFADSAYSGFNVWNANRMGVLLKVKHDGSLEWMRKFDNFQNQPNSQYDELLKGIEEVADGGYIACGVPYAKSDAETWIIRVDSNGCFNSSCLPSNVGIRKYVKNENITIYPQPAKGALNLSFEIAQANDFKTISIYNSLGQLVKEEEITFNNMKASINITNLPTGIYLLKLRDDNRNLEINKRFVIDK